MSVRPQFADALSSKCVNLTNVKEVYRTKCHTFTPDVGVSMYPDDVEGNVDIVQALFDAWDEAALESGTDHGKGTSARIV